MNRCKNIITLTVFLISSVVILAFSGCEEKETYNFDEIEPELVGGISGPKEVVADGFCNYNYSVIHRGGSSYKWSIENYDAEINKNSKYPNQATILYAQSMDSATAYLTVKETTMGGKSTSTTDTIEILPFCPYPMDDYTGKYLSSDTINVADTVISEITTIPNQLRIYGLADFVVNRWGETWINGDGSCVIDFCCNNVIEIQRQWIGDTNYPDTYMIEGTGTVDTTNKVITLNYYVLYAGGTSNKSIDTELSLDL